MANSARCWAAEKRRQLLNNRYAITPSRYIVNIYRVRIHCFRPPESRHPEVDGR